MGNSAVVVNVHIIPKGSTGGLGGFSKYLAHREGAVLGGSEDDRLLAHHADLAQMSSYFGQRPGAVTEEGSALFDRNGVLGVAEARERLEAIESSAIMMVVSVRNCDAARLGLDSKEAWERLARGCVDRYVASTGVMGIADVSWLSAYHINSKSHHVHVVAWDRSGRWDGKMLPKAKMVAANSELREAALGPARNRLGLERTLARDELVAAFKDVSGLNPADALRLRAYLPESGRTSLEHLSRDHHEAAAAFADEMRLRISSSPRLAEAKVRYETASRELGRLKGLSGDALGAHVSKANEELERRCGNALIGTVKEAPALGSAQTPAMGSRCAPAPAASAHAHERDAREAHGFAPSAPAAGSLRHAFCPVGASVYAGDPARKKKRKELEKEHRPTQSQYQ